MSDTDQFIARLQRENTKLKRDTAALLAALKAMEYDENYWAVNNGYTRAEYESWRAPAQARAAIAAVEGVE